MGVAVIALSLYCGSQLWLKTFRRFQPILKNPFCQRTPAFCLHNHMVKSILVDYRKTRDAQFHPSGTHTLFREGYEQLDSCTGHVQLHYSDPRLLQWWGHLLPAQDSSLPECDTPCAVTKNISDADVLIGLLDPPFQASEKEWWQKMAVVNLEAHSIRRENMARTDLFVSFHKQADVVVNYLYALKHGVPCDQVSGNCLFSAVSDSVKAESSSRPAVRRGKVAMFISGTCDRFGHYLQLLLARLMGKLKVDSFGRCFNNRREIDDPLAVPDKCVPCTRTPVCERVRVRVCVLPIKVVG